MRVTTELVLPDVDVEAFYPTYVRAWEPLLTRAAARHLLTAEEFAKEMADPRIEKVLVRDEDDRALAMTTITTDLAVVEWINPEYYRARYPDAFARGAMFYLGYTLVDQTRRTNALLMMAAEINRRVAAVDGVIGFDICGHNDAHGVGRHTRRIFGGAREIGRLDTQTYYAADYGEAEEPTGLLDLAGPARDGVASSPGRRPGASGGSLRTLTLAERPDLAGDIAGVLTQRWPAFMLAGQPGHEVDLDALLMEVPQHQVLAVDDRDRLHGVGLSLPIRWDGTPAGLPAGWDAAVAAGAGLAAEGGTPDTVCALSVTVTGSSAGRGIASMLIKAMREAAATAGAGALVAPVRPTLKTRYPLVPMETYLGWLTPEGAVFDPWLRLHLRLGAEVLEVAHASMRVSGTVEDWQHWTGEDLPGPGSYVVPGALAPLVVADGRGTYVEPNVWVVHRLDGPVAPGVAAA